MELQLALRKLDGLHDRVDERSMSLSLKRSIAATYAQPKFQKMAVAVLGVEMILVMFVKATTRVPISDDIRELSDATGVPHA